MFVFLHRSQRGKERWYDYFKSVVGESGPKDFVGGLIWIEIRRRRW